MASRVDHDGSGLDDLIPAETAAVRSRAARRRQIHRRRAQRRRGRRRRRWLPIAPRARRSPPRRDDGRRGPALAEAGDRPRLPDVDPAPAPASAPAPRTGAAAIGADAGFVATSSIPPDVPGQAWWQYRREAPPEPPTVPPPDHETRDAAGGPPPDGPGPAGADTPDPGDPSGARPAPAPAEESNLGLVTSATVFVLAAFGAQVDVPAAGPVMVGALGIFLALAAARRITRLRPDEAWVGRWLVAGVIVKLVASFARYRTLIGTYEGVGDATGYDRYGREFAAFWAGQGPDPALPNLTQTNFVRWFTGVVYYVFGSNTLVGFFAFGLLALLGSYLWYRATVDAVPIVNRRLYLGFVLFAPSVAFWPSSIGKESLMQLGIGAMALGASFLFRQRILPAAVVGLAGGWLVWVVRPHLLAIVTIAIASAYLAGRVRKDGNRSAPISRFVGLVLIVGLLSVAVSQGAEFLGMEDFSLSSIRQELDETTERSSRGGSRFDSGENSLNPLYLPHGAVTVLLRPFPWETEGGLQLLASLESILLAGIVLVRFASVRAAAANARRLPFLMFAWVLTILYAMSFSSLANFGLLVRQRSLVLPAVAVLVAVDPILARRRAAREQASPPAEPSLVAPGRPPG